MHQHGNPKRQLGETSRLQCSVANRGWQL